VKATPTPIAFLGGMLDTWMEGVKRAGVKNALVVALDAETKATVDQKGLFAHQMSLKVCHSA
jgi:arabinosyltransferase